jgi:hypothetical protein
VINRPPTNDDRAVPFFWWKPTPGIAALALVHSSEGPCSRCGTVEELRLGVCFDCAEAGEAHAARRSVAMHLLTAVKNVGRRRLDYSRFDLTWAWQRLTRTGDYASGGTFEREYGVEGGPTESDLYAYLALMGSIIVSLFVYGATKGQRR